MGNTYKVAIDIIQGKDPSEITTKLERSAMLVAEIAGSTEFCL